MRVLVTILLGAVLFFPLSGFATEIGPGPVYGHWYSSGNPYNVNGDINVPAHSTLYIHEGVEVIFQGLYSFDVYGFLEAMGTESDSIHFFPADTGTGWEGISFSNAPDSSYLAYCTIQYAQYAGGLAGGINCNSSSPVISHCTISHCEGIWGGGIYFDNVNAELSYCTITGNQSILEGGGIYLYRGSPLLSHCTISDNSGEDGGGICAFNCNSPIFFDCLVSGNTATGSTGRGGGIYIYSSSTPSLTGCVISDNYAPHGGGIYLIASTTLTSCAFLNNEAGDWDTGGAVHCFGTYDFSYCTFSGGFGSMAGGIYLIGNATVDHCTFNDLYSAACAADIYVETGSASVSNCTHSNIGTWSAYALCGVGEVAYSDFYGDCNGVIGGPTGFGELTQVNANGDSCDVYFNIFLDPVFVGPYSEDFYLRWRSPCIDAGDPNSPLDPDNTVCDMGRYYFDQDVLGVVEVYPHGEPVVIPPGGGQLVYDGWVFNFTGHPGRADIWTYAFVPGVGRYGPIDLYRNFRIPPDSIGMNNIRQKVPGLAPEGDYTLVAYVGRYPSTIIDSSYFYFRKEGSVAGEIGDWSSSGLLTKAVDETAFNLPSHYALLQSYPNPFNAATTIHYQLPADTEVKLEVYNTLGQKVATLVDSKQQSGYRSVTWDASEVSSGVYFYKVTAGDYTEIKRMMLVK
jgi:parallel beta-helix repeat protein